MRIVIDLQGLQTPASAGRGVGRYTESLVKQILRRNSLDCKHEIFIALNGKFRDSTFYIRNSFAGLIDQDHIVVWQQFYETSAFSGADPAVVKAAKVSRELFLNSLKPDVIFSTNLQEGLTDSAITSVRSVRSNAKYVTTLHDAVPFYYDYLGDDVTRNWYLSKIYYAQQSDLVVTVSAAAKAQIIENTGIAAESVVVVSNGYDPTVFHSGTVQESVTSETACRYGIDGDYVLYYGGADIHKNLERLVKGFAHYRAERPSSVTKLVLGGGDVARNASVNRCVSDLDLTDAIVLPGFLEEADLPIVTKGAIACVFPSLHEGFGLPALEAMACGVATFGAKGSSVADIIMNPEALFDGTSEKAIAEILSKAINDNAFRVGVAEKGLARAQDFSWERAAREFLFALDTLDVSSEQSSSYYGPISLFCDHMGDDLSKIGDRTKVAIAHSIAESLFDDRRARLFVDISSVFVHDYKSGIQRVTRAICRELTLRADSSFEIVLVYAPPGEALFVEANSYLRDVLGIDRGKENTHAEMQRGDVLLFLDLNPGVVITHDDYCDYLRSKGIKVFHVVYDLLPIVHPASFWPALCHEFQDWVRAVSRSDGAVCISQAVALELQEHLSKFGAKRVDPFRIGWFHLGADIGNSVPSHGLPANADDVLRRVRTATSFLMVGTIEPRKGHVQTIAAFERLWNAGNEDVVLVIVGRLGWGMSDFASSIEAHPEAGRRLFWLSGISDEYLEEIYRSTSCLIAASEGEGFGLPLIEAAQRGIPLIIRDIPVFREVAGAYAQYFDDTRDPVILDHAVRAWLKSFHEGEHIRSTDMPFLTWEESTQQLLDVISHDEWQLEAEGGGALIPNGVVDIRGNNVDWTGFNEPVDLGRAISNDVGEIDFVWRSAVERIFVRISLFSSVRARLRLFLNGVQLSSIYLHEGMSEYSFGCESIRDGINKLALELEALDPARRRDGSSGVGVSRLEFGQLGDVIADGQLVTYKSDGINWHSFARAEDGFRWSLERGSEIGFFWDGDPQEADLRLSLVGCGKQLVKVEVNGSDACSAVVSGGHPRLSPPQHIYSAINISRGYNCIRLEVPGAQNPGGNDDRTLGVAIRDFRLTAVTRPITADTNGPGNLDKHGAVPPVGQGGTSFEPRTAERL